ncbi:DEAD/DEAH box helicase family protein, partial [Lactobacillus sp. LC28-10]
MYQLHPYQKTLVSQARQALRKGSHSVLLQSPAGSGKSVIIAEIARLAVKKGGTVMFMVHRKELVRQIKDSFRENEVDLSQCIISTVGKIANRLDTLPKPSLIITDESHHSLAKTYVKIYAHFSDVPRLGFSATPWRLNGKGLHDVYDTMVEGPRIDWLIENYYLAPY